MKRTVVDDLIFRVPDNQIEPLSDKLIDNLLSSQKPSAIPPGLIKAILTAGRDGVLKTKGGTRFLLEASMLAEKEKTPKILLEMGLEEAAEMAEAIAREV
jgi:hypothetical protein